ncbi:hypothetical protein [Rheinheimera pacifica]|uniref:hypothetical protein n=1 Tax=Rheinheimera pacifica TaxID=173990 RepID=UPI002EDB3164
MIKAKWAVAVLLALSCMSANAGSQVGKVGYLLVRASDGLVYFTIEGAAKIDSPACAKNTYWMIRDENSEVGKKQYAMLLAAQASGRELTVRGMNTCNRWSDGEDLDWLQLR